jgi:cell division septation protein DedD
VTAVQAGQTYLQVAAVKKPQAEMLVEVLKEKGFHAVSSPTAPGAELYRALVGPLRDAAEVARTKADLENAGFKPITKRF